MTRPEVVADVVDCACDVDDEERGVCVVCGDAAGYRSVKMGERGAVCVRCRRDGHWRLVRDPEHELVAIGLVAHRRRVIHRVKYARNGARKAVL